MITLDTSGLFALLNRRDPDHERRGGRVLTFDWRHFGVVARPERIRVVPE